MGGILRESGGRVAGEATLEELLGIAANAVVPTPRPRRPGPRESRRPRSAVPPDSPAERILGITRGGQVAARTA
ncbi:hypothetical protein FHR81_000158 [Actinoalloteichus hoggarensis]|uniref:Uncharacterized protein n=1 Tax=Actinoalloteichus hoggarensis TaxID=1470176 RepID=A0A221W2Z4_9PSEU|nr:hypothetical protein [Actinoalloteichus hoggarensis]ASO20158.1 hypothetical protein AHOG_12575 [Actinoalloteichus hoggarensis]MBB5919129.1 hypothetical protein [Actinoalloteichus hoggarensis]